MDPMHLPLTVSEPFSETPGLPVAIVVLLLHLTCLSDVPLQLPASWGAASAALRASSTSNVGIHFPALTLG